MAWKFAGYTLAAVLTYYLASLIQAAFHLLFAHRKAGGILYSNHIDYHHALYSRGRMVSDRYLPEEKSNTPYYFLPVALVGWGVYRLLPFDIFLVHLTSVAFCFYAHVYLHEQYHLTNSWLHRFKWFQRKQQLHFVHHRRTSKNFATIEFFWDRVFGTYQSANANAEQGQVWTEQVNS